MIKNIAGGGTRIADSVKTKMARLRSTRRARPRRPFPIRHPRAAIRNCLALLVIAACLAASSDQAGASDACEVRDDAARLLEVGGGAGGAGAKSHHAAAGAGVPAVAGAASGGAESAAPAEIKIVSYNIRWRGGDDLRRLIETLRTDKEIGGAHVIGLQEVDRNRRRSGNVNAARVMAESLGMYYAWAAPPSDGKKRDDREAGEDETGVAILSVFPVTDVERLVLPHAGPGCRRRAGIGATVNVGGRELRVYSLHAETRLEIAKKTEQWGAAIDSLARRPAVTRAVVLGDFNSIKGKDVRASRKLFDGAGFSTPFADDKSTWKTFVFKLKLDWLWLRGLEATSHGIAKHVGYSDHWPLWVKVKLKSTED